jgi:hypothetical protein
MCWRDGFDGVAAVLRPQGGQQLGHVGPQVGARERPAGIAGLDQLLQVDRLVGAMEGAESEMQDHELRERTKGHGAMNWLKRRRRGLRG